MPATTHSHLIDVTKRTCAPATQLLQRKCACGQYTGGTQCDECKKKHETLQRYPANRAQANSVPPFVNEVLRSPGRPLNRETRAFMEPRFGHDFSQVRVHTDNNAAESARIVNAWAYTVGNHIVFASSRYSPETHEGRHLLAHELTHTMQQRHGMQQMQHTSADTIEDDEQLEREAEETASAVTSTQLPEVGFEGYLHGGEVIATGDTPKKRGRRTKLKSKAAAKPKAKPKPKPKSKPNPCKRTILSEGSCADLVQGSKYRCCDPARGLDNQARDTDIEGKACTSHKFTPQFTCEKHCTDALAKGCNDSDHWMAIPGKRQAVMAQCGQTYTICANGKKTTGYVRDRSVTRKSYEVSPGILQALGLPLGSSFSGAAYKSGTAQSTIDGDRCCTPAPQTSPTPSPSLPPVGSPPSDIHDSGENFLPEGEAYA